MSNHLVSDLVSDLVFGLVSGLVVSSVIASLGACSGNTSSGPQPAAPTAATSDSLQVERFAAREADVNAYLVHRGDDAVLIDCTRSADDAAGFVAMIKRAGLTPTHLLITHGHPDHYLGMGTLLGAFPDLRIVVARDAIKADIIGFTGFMESAGWLQDLPAMKRKTAENPDGFDYGQIQVLDSPELAVGASVLRVRSDHAPSEAEHMTTITVPEDKILFTSDLAYNQVHLWLGNGVTDAHIRNWQALLDTLTRDHGDYRIFPGHGAPTDASIFAANSKYMDQLIATVNESESAEAAHKAMVAHYPEHANADFLLKMSVDFQFQQAKAR